MWIVIGDSYVSEPWGQTTPTSSGLVKEQDANIAAIRKRKPLAGRHPYLKNKELIGIPWRLAFALQQDGWYLRSDIIFHKLNPLPLSVTSRPTTAHEYIFLLAKNERYYYDYEAIKEEAESKNSRDGKRNKRSVWSVPIEHNKEKHVAVYPKRLVEPCVLAGCPENGTILDPFSGAATTGMVALNFNRNYVGIEVNKDFVELSKNRLDKFILTGNYRETKE